MPISEINLEPLGLAKRTKFVFFRSKLKINHDLFGSLLAYS